MAIDTISKLQLSVLILAMKAVSMILTLSLLCACQTPMLTLAGKQLKGIEATTTNFAFAEPTNYSSLKLIRKSPTRLSSGARYLTVNSMLTQRQPENGQSICIPTEEFG
ncbi:MAG: hypothetical protein NZ777_07860 [Pseudomonadales bacterium]|nr:hypothetical protein [Pseudomonadales bacterium]